MIKVFKEFLYETKNITEYSINNNVWHLAVGMYEIDYLEELLTYDLKWKDDIKTYYYEDIELFKERLNPLIEEFNNKVKGVI